MAVNGQEINAPRYQAEVYFAEFPSLDLEALTAFIDNTDDAEPDACIIEATPEVTLDGVRIATCLIHVGGKHASMVLTGAPTADMSMLDVSGMREDHLEVLKAHKCHALLTAFGGDEDESPSELVIMLTKIAVGLCHQNGLGYYLHSNGSAYDGPSLLRMIEQHEALEKMNAEDASTSDMVERLIEMLGPGAREGALGAMLDQMREAAADADVVEDEGDELLEYEEEGEDDLEDLTDEDGAEDDEEFGEEEDEDDGSEETGSLWSAVRNLGEPFPLLAAIEVLPPVVMGDGRSEGQVLISRGFAHCGFPDLMYYTTDAEEDLSPVAEMFQNAFGYMMKNGPVLEEGHSMGYDENHIFQFAAPPESFKAPFETYAMLMVTKATAEE